MKIGVLFSGGKDSCLALHKAKQGGHEIVCLLSILPDNFDSFMFHKPYVNLLKKQAERLGMKLIVKKSKGIEEKEVDDLRDLINDIKEEVDGIVVGGIASSYQGNRIKKICDDLGLEFIAPLWDYGAEKVWNELLDEGFEVILTKIACDGLGSEWLGKVIGLKELEDLKKLGEKYKFRIDFEGGEAESAVLNMPGFSGKIDIDFEVVSEGSYRHWMEGLEVRG